MSVAYGIDLGTTYSVIAAVDEYGRPMPLDAADGRPITPSVVHFGEVGSVSVGADAKAMMRVEPDRTRDRVKNLMGTDVTFPVDGEDHTPESISALILKYLVDSVHTGPAAPSAVITVPAHFGIAEREATQQAALMAGIDVLDLVAEPVAAAISYGVQSDDSGDVLVYDLGGGTFDTTVIRLTSNGPVVLVTDGVHDLGGTHWDARLTDHLIEAFVAAVGPAEDPFDDDEFYYQVQGMAEDLKKNLSVRREAKIGLTFRGKSAFVVVTRADFESFTKDLLDQTLDATRRTLDAAVAKGSRRIDKVLLVGGSSRMPMVAESLQSLFQVPVLLQDPDFAVAKGAAIRATYLAEAGRLQSTGRASASSGRISRGGRSSGATPRAVGVLIWDTSRAGVEPLEIVDHLIDRNEQLPISGKRRFATVMDGQDQVRIRVFEQAGAVVSPEKDHNRPVLDGLLTGLPQLKAGSPIEVTLTLGEDGRLSVRAVEPTSGRELNLESFVEGASDTAETARMHDVVGRLSASR